MRKINFLPIICIALLSLLAILVSAQNEKIDIFKEKYGQNWIINWNDLTDTPHTIYGSIYNLNVGGIETKEKAEQVAYSFLSDNKDFFGIDKNDIKLFKAEEGNNEWYVEYQQYYNELLVYNGKVSATLSKNGELVAVGSDLYSNIDIDTSPQLSEEEALQKAKTQFGHEAAEVKNSSLIIYSKDINDYHLTWRISVFSERPVAGKEYFIDANTGEILLQYDTVVSSSVPQKRTTDVKTESNKTDTKWFLPSLVGVIVILLIVLISVRRRRKVKKSGEAQR